MTKRILLVEGRDDEHVFKNLCGLHDLPLHEEITRQEGYPNLLQAFPLRLKESDVEAVGVVIDADTDPASRWESIRNHLIRAGYTDVPINPVPDGLILEPPANTILPRVGAWIMPDNETSGSLENFLLQLVPDGDRLFAYAGTCVDHIEPGLRLFRDVDEPKALIHTWLAWQNEPGRPYGVSIKDRVLRTDNEAALKIVNWLKKLFFQ